MKKKKGKVLAMELVDDLFTDSKSKVKKSGFKKTNKPPPTNSQDDSSRESLKTEVVDLPTELSAVDSDLTTKLTPEEMSKFSTQSIDQGPPTIDTNQPVITSLRTHGGTLSSTEMDLNHSMNLKKAQEKILDLEQIIEDVRRENEKLLAASHTFKKHSEELQVRASDLEKDLSEQNEQFKEEKKIIEASLERNENLLNEERLEKEQLKSRLDTNLKKIRVRERELENRLEIVRLENFSLQRSKDEHLLGLKRQIDEAQIELESYRDKGKILNLQLQKKKEMLRKTVKALRLALTMLESNEKELKLTAGDD